MAQNNQLSQIIKYGLDNKKKQDEMMSAGLSAGFTPSQIGAELEVLEKSGVFESIVDPQQPKTGIGASKGGEFLKADQVTSLGEGDVALSSLGAIEKTLLGRENIGGPVSGRIKAITGGEETGALQSEFEAATKVVGGFLEGGKLTDPDFEAYQEIMPNLADSADERAKKIANLNQQIKDRRNILLDTYAKTGFDVSGFEEKAGAEDAEPQADTKVIAKQFEDDLTAARADLEADPENQNAKRFIDDWDNDRFDMKTGKLKAVEKTEADLTEVEKRMVDQGLPVEGYNPQTEQPTSGGEQEKKGFGEAFGELRGAEKELGSITEKQEALTPEIEERNQKAKDLSLVGNYERALEAKDDPQAQAFLDKLTDEDKAKITELQKLTPEEREAKRQELLTGQQETQEKLGGFSEQIDTATAKGEEAIKSNRGLETFGDVAEVGTGIIEAGKEGAGTVGEAFSRAMNDNQDPASTGIQVVGALGKFLGESAGALTFGAGKVLLPQGAEDAIGEGATKAVNAVLETEVGQKGVEMAREGGEDWEKFKKENPTAAANLEGVAGIIEGVSTVGGGGVAKSVTKKGLKTAGGVVKDVGGKTLKGAGSLGSKAKKIIPDVKVPKFTKTPEAQAKKIEDVLTNIATKPVKNFVEKARKNGIDVNKELSKSNILQGTVDEAGTITTGGDGGAIETYTKKYIDGLDKKVAEGLKKEAKNVSIKDVEKSMIDSIKNTEGMVGKVEMNAIKEAKAEIKSMARHIDKDGNIPLHKVNDLKKSIYSTINHNTEAGTKLGKTESVKGLRKYIEESSDNVLVSNINKKLTKHYTIRDYLEKLNGNKVEGGRLGKLLSGVTGAVGGAALGISTGGVSAFVMPIIGGTIGKTLKGKLMKRTFGKKIDFKIKNSKNLTKDEIKIVNNKLTKEVKDVPKK